MKKTSLLSLLISIFAFNLFAQPTITSSYNPIYADTFAYKIVVDTAAMQPGSAGAGVVWNLSSLPSTLNTREFNFMQPQFTNYATVFPTANMAAEIVDVTQGGTTYEFYNTSTTSYKEVGTVVFSAQDNFTNGFRIFAYPFTFGQSYSDSVTGSNGVANITGVVTTTYDAYGTLNLPAQSGGVFNNVGRIKIDEVLVYNYGAGLDIVSHIVTYLWMDNTPNNMKKQPILYMSTKDLSGLQTDHKKSAGIRQILFTNSVPQLNFNSANVSVYPNPFHDKIALSLTKLNTKVTVQISDMTGKIVKEICLEKSVAEETLYLNDLREGVYFAKISSEKGSVIKRIVKE